MRNSRGLSKLVWLAIIAWLLVTVLVGCFVLSSALKSDHEKKVDAAIEACRMRDFDKAEVLLLEAVALGKKANDRGEGIILAVRRLGQLYQDTGDYQRAEKFFQEDLNYSRAATPFSTRLALVCLCNWERAAYDHGFLEKQDSKYADEFLEGQSKSPLTFYGHDLAKIYGSKIFYLLANKDYMHADEWLKKGLSEKTMEAWQLSRPDIETKVHLGKAQDAVDLILKAKQRADKDGLSTALEQALRAAAGDPSGTDGVGNIGVLFKTNQLVDKRDFEGLDKYAAQLVASKAHDRSGHWQIEDFYDCLEGSSGALTTRMKEREAFLNDWSKARPDSDPAKIALAHFLIQYAWKARGGGYADTVSKDGAKLFQERLQQAQDNLEKVKKHDPGYYSAAQRLLWVKAGTVPTMNRCLKNAEKLTRTTWTPYSKNATGCAPAGMVKKVSA